MRLFAAIAAVLAALSFTSPAQAQDPRYQFPQQYSMSPKGVNLQTGRFIYSKTDLTIGNLTFTRKWGEVPAYTVNNRANGILEAYDYSPGSGWSPMNIGWTHSFNQGVVFIYGSTPQVFVVVDGATYSFLVLSNGYGPMNQSTVGTTLTAASGQWIFTDRNGASYTFVSLSGMQQNGQNGSPGDEVLQSVVYPDGGRIDYSYNAAAQPKFVKSNAGYAIALDYDGNGNVSAACGFNLAQTYADASTSCTGAALKTSYGYDSTGKHLVTVTDTLGRVVTITYTMILNTVPASDAVPTCISLPNSSTCEIANTYGAGPGNISAYDDQVWTQVTAAGATWTYEYIPQPDPADQPVVAGQPRFSRSYMHDPAGQTVNMRYDRGRLVTSQQPSGTIEYRYRGVTSGGITPVTYQYFDVSPGLVTMPEGNREYFEHDNRGNITLHSYWPKGASNAATTGNTTQDQCCINPDPVTPPAGSVSYSRTFLGDYGYYTILGNTYIVGCGAGAADAKLCNKPMTATDANGNVTDYTYDQATGNVLTETAPAVNGVRAQTRYNYAQRYAWVKTSGGGYTQAATPVWVLTQTSICKSGAASGGGCAVTGDEVRTSYDYGPDSGPNNLLLRGVVNDATGAALRTCYGYDGQGNKISETKPRAGLTVCP